MTQDRAHESELEGNVERLLKSADSPPRMSAEARARVLDELLAEQARRAAARRPSRRGPWWADTVPRSLPGRVGLLAAAVAFAAAVLFLLTRPGLGPPAVAYDNAGPGPRVVVLRDGTSLTLDVGAVVLESAPGQVRLTAGRAVFDVHLTGASFSLETPQGGATAEHARFVVSASPESAEIAVAKGRVDVGTGDRRLAVHAGELGTLRGEAPPLAARAPRVSHLFDFARVDHEGVSPPADGLKGTLIGRDPRWQHEVPIDLRELSVDVVVDRGFARTTIDQTFFNPTQRQLEGVYSFPMPHGAAISRLAMYVDGELMESAIVDRSRGRDIYEGIVHQRRDPALLEWMSGNTFRMRIFPVPARTEKRIFSSYTQPLEHLYGRERLIVPIPEIDQLASRVKFSVRVVDGESFDIASPSHAIEVSSSGPDRVVSYQATDAKLGKDFVLSLRRTGAAAPQATAHSHQLDGERYFLARSEPNLRELASERGTASGRRVAVLFDVSASRDAAQLSAQARFTDGLLDALDPEDQVTLLTVGHEVELLPGGLVEARKLDRQLVASFLSAHAEGVGDTRLDLALAAARTALGSGSEERVVYYVGDGTFVAQGEPVVQENAAKRLHQALGDDVRFVGVGVGDAIDRGTLSALAELSNGLVLQVAETDDLSQRAFDAVSTMYTPCLGGLSAEALDAAGKPVVGAVAQVTSRRVCDGERVEVVLRAPVGTAPSSVRVRGRVAGSAGDRLGTPWETALSLVDAKSGGEMLPRLFAERRIAALLADEPPGPGRAESPNRAEVVALARRHFLVTPFTSLLVLENDAMYKEYAVEKSTPTGWAVYQAPARIPSRYEPLGSEALGARAFDLLERAPTRLFHDYGRGGPALQLGLVGALVGPSPAARASGVRMGWNGAEPGFGSGSGRLGGAHRERPFKVSTDSLRSQRQLARRGVSLMDRSVDLPSAGEALADSPAPAHTAGSAWTSGDSDGFLQQAFAGAHLVAFRYEGDPRLSDLTELAPGLFTQPVDAAADYLASTPPTANRSAEALKLLSRALPLRTGTFSLPDGTVLTLGEDETVITRPLALGGSETSTVSREGLRHSYPELGLRTLRSPSPALVFWLAEQAPMAPPPIELTEGLNVELLGPATIRISPVQPPSNASELELPSLVLELDGQGRLLRLTSGAGSSRIEHHFELAGSDLVHRRGVDQRSTYTARPAAERAKAELVDVSLPLAHPSHWLDRIKEPGQSVDKPFARRQLMAAYAALGDQDKLREQLLALAAESPTLMSGDAVLGSRAIFAHDDAGTVLAKVPEGAVRSYLELARKPAELRGPGFARFAEQVPGSALGAVAAFRSVLADVDQGKRGKATLEAARSFGRRFGGARFFRYVLARRLAESCSWEDAKCPVAAWDLLTEDEQLRPIADLNVARVSRGRGDSADVSARATRAIDAAFERGLRFELDWGLRAAVTQTHGELGMQLLLAKWRARLAKSGSGPQIASFVLATHGPYRSGAEEDVSVLLRRLATIETKPGVRIQIAAALMNARKAPEAKRVLAAVLRDKDVPPVALELGSAVAEHTGDLDAAAALLDRLLRETESSDVDLRLARVWYAHLVELHVRRASDGSSASAALADATRVASRWRREDGGNAEVDELMATLLFEAGRETEAMRFLSSIPERNPAEGGAWGKVAEVLQRQGDLNGTIAAVEQASRVEPTNPTWAVQHAQALWLRAQPGDHARAQSLLEQVLAQSAKPEGYQPRFAGAVAQASQLAAVLKTQRP